MNAKTKVIVSVIYAGIGVVCTALAVGFFKDSINVFKNN